MSVIKRKFCNGEGCKKERAIGEFYTSNSIMFSDGFVPICKKCIKSLMNENDLESIKKTLQRIDKPFIAKVWKSSEESNGDTVGTYFRMINSLQQYKDWNWSDSDFEGENETSIYKHKFDNLEEIEELETEFGTIFLTKEIALKYGSGFTNREYLEMEKFYREMENTHDISSPQTKKQVVLLCKLQIQMDRALENDDDGAFKNYNDRYEKILQSSGFRPIDQKDSVEKTGMRSFSSIFEEVERRGYVEPKPITERMDLVDIAMREFINYDRVIDGQPRLEKAPTYIMDKLEEANGRLMSDEPEFE